jgi:enamine deaminase RidA (YjgF/YER057c/UK114 family)
VASDAGQEAVLAEQRLQVAGALGDPLRRHADVLDDQRRAGQAQATDQAVQALAHAPGQLDALGLAGEIDRPDRLVAGENLLGLCNLGG